MKDFKTESVNKKTIELNDIEHSIKYQPLSYDAYKFFTKFSPFIEKVIINNINKYNIHNNPIDIQELKAFTKMEKDFKISEELIQEIKFTDYKVNFTSMIYSSRYINIGF
jgi:hypothetical protein